MKACVYRQYGPPEVLHVEDVAKPAPSAHEVLVRVRATSVNFGDLIARDFASVTPRRFHMPLFLWLPARLAFGVRAPRQPILGSEFAGDVEAVGASVTRFKTGDPVFGYVGQGMGAYAEYLCVGDGAAVARKPDRLRYEDAAVLPYGALMAVGLLRKVDIRPGQQVLIHGASGGIGAAAVQIARHRGAEVTGVCGAPRRAFVKALGAHKVIDYAEEDFTRSGVAYDVILDVLGTCSFSRCKAALKPQGTLLYASFKTRQLLQMAWTAMVGGQRVVCAFAPGDLADLRVVEEMVDAGALTAHIHHRYPLEQAAEAHRCAASGQRLGQVVITVA